MRYHYRLLLFLLITIALAACVPPTEEPVVDEAARVQADVEAIKSLNEQLLAAGNEGDVSSWLTFFADDAVFMPPNEQPITGKEALQSWAQPQFDQYTYDESWSSEDIQMFGDWAFNAGAYTMTVTPTDGGEPIQEEGKFINIYQRQLDGSWKISKIIWNSNAPPPDFGEKE